MQIVKYYSRAFQLLRNLTQYLYKTDTILIDDFTNCQNQLRYQPFFVDSQTSDLIILAGGSKSDKMKQ